LADKANHHYVPQFYLRGFSDGLGRKARVFTFDQSTNKSFTTLVRNVASKRHFNRVEIEGVDPNYLEDGLSEMEGELAPFLAEVIEAKCFPSHDHFNWVMNLAAHLSVRNPRLRGQLEGFHKDIAERVGALSVSSREVWESQVRQLEENEDQTFPNVTYESAKKFHNEKNYDIIIDQTHLIGLEVKMIDPVLKELGRRNWCFVSPVKGEAFITSDDPVVLSWADGKDRGFCSPGHGVLGTLIAFPLSTDLLLLGAFENLPKTMEYNAFKVADMNTHVARYSTNQIYSRTGDFRINMPGRDFVCGNDLPGLMIADKRRRSANKS